MEPLRGLCPRIDGAGERPMSSISETIDSLIRQEEDYLMKLSADAACFPQAKRIEADYVDGGYYSVRDMLLLFEGSIECLPVIQNHIMMECLP